MVATNVPNIKVIMYLKTRVIFFSHGLAALVGLGFLIVEVP
jgi:hypothetical protein